MQRDFGRADAIREELRVRLGVLVHDALTLTLAPTLALTLTLTLTRDPHPKQVHDANRTWRVAQPNHAAGVAFGGGGGGGGGGGRHGGGGGGSGGGYGGGGGFGGGGGAGRLVTPSPRPASSTRPPILFK